MGLLAPLKGGLLADGKGRFPLSSLLSNCLKKGVIYTSFGEHLGYLRRISAYEISSFVRNPELG